MKYITRPHFFENRLDLVRQGQRSYYLFHEKSIHPVIIRRTPELDRAFLRFDWSAFIAAEAKALGGEA